MEKAKGYRLKAEVLRLKAEGYRLKDKATESERALPLVFSLQPVAFTRRVPHG